MNAEALRYVIHTPHGARGWGRVSYTPTLGRPAAGPGVQGGGRGERVGQFIQGHLLGLHAHSPSEEREEALGLAGVDKASADRPSHSGECTRVYKPFMSL